MSEKTEIKTYGKELDLILLMTDGNYYSATEMAEFLGVTRRHLYNYFMALRQKGFCFDHRSNKYAIDLSSPFFETMRAHSQLTGDEAYFICRSMAELELTNNMARAICTKLKRTFSLPDFTDTKDVKRITGLMSKLQDAIVQKATVKLKDYSSPHSNTVSDRIVEPFMMMRGGSDVICYELSSGMCKTFKVSRIGKVEILNLKWTYENKHLVPYTDVFGFTGNERHHVSLRLDRLARNLLEEEFPSTQALIVPDGEDHWTVDLICVSLLGVTRFVMGLYDNIKILGDDEFRNHIHEKIASLKG